MSRMSSDPESVSAAETLLRAEMATLRHLKDEMDRIHDEMTRRMVFVEELRARRNGAPVVTVGKAKAKTGSPLAKRTRRAGRSGGLAVAVDEAMVAIRKDAKASAIVEHMEAGGYTFKAKTPKDVLVRAVLRRGAATGRYVAHKDKTSGRVTWSLKEGTL
jgi:hypothetical protein